MEVIVFFKFVLGKENGFKEQQIQVDNYSRVIQHLRSVITSYPELLNQVHVGSLVLLHAALRDAGHVSSQCAVDQHTQHVQHCCEKLTVGTETHIRAEVADQETDNCTGKRNNN